MKVKSSKVYVSFTGAEFVDKEAALKSERDFLQQAGISDSLERIKAELKLKDRTLQTIERALIIHELRLRETKLTEVKSVG